MLQNAYFLAKIGADTAENDQHFAEILPIGRRVEAHVLPRAPIGTTQVRSPRPPPSLRVTCRPENREKLSKKHCETQRIWIIRNKSHASARGPVTRVVKYDLVRKSQERPGSSRQAARADIFEQVSN